MARRLKELRDARTLSTRELARQAGVAQDTITKLEGGRRGAHPGTIRKLAAALNVSASELGYLRDQGGENSPKVRASHPSEVEKVSDEAQRRRFNYLAGGLEQDVARWDRWISEVRDSADVPGTDPRTWARTIGLAAVGRYADVEAQGAVEALAEAGRTPEGARLRAALDALLAIPQRAADASVGARQVSAVLEEVEGRAPEVLALEKQASLAT